MENKLSHKTFLFDGTKCIGCRGCQIACKQWNNLPAEETKFFGGPGYQNPKHLSARTYTLIKFHEDLDVNGKLKSWSFWKNQCQHCLKPGCASACPVGALHKKENGPVVWNEDKCIGCRYCMIACPFGIPKFEWNKVIADIQKCNLCADRIDQGQKPSCAKTCATNAILYGDRDELVEIAKKRLRENPDKYYQHIYGLKEVGGTGILNISSIPLEKFGYPANLPDKAIENYTAAALHTVPGVVIGLGAVLGLTAFVANRKNKIARAELNENIEENE